MQMAVLIAIFIVIVFFAAILSMVFKLAPEYELLVIFRLGRCIGQKGPGLVPIIPVIDRIVRVDIREKYLDIFAQTLTTKENAHISIDFRVYWKVTDAVKSALKANINGALQGIAIPFLRDMICEISLNDIPAKSGQIGTTLQAKMDEVTERWGVKITSIEIKKNIPL